MARPVATSRLSVRARQRQLVADASNGLGFLATQALTQAFAAAVAEAGATQSRQLQALAQVFQRANTDTNARLAIHERIAKLARTSVIQSYGQLVTRQEGPASATHYRAGSGRFAAGKLLAALGDPAFIEASPDGINFGNILVLDTQAAQWHRINFGAAGRGTGSHTSFEVRFNNVVVAALGLDQGPSPGFTMPRGIFVSPGGERVPFGGNARGADLFYPRTQGAGRSRYSNRRAVPSPISGRQSAGIYAKNFLDAGLARIANEIGPAYSAYYAGLFERARAGTGPLASSVLVRPRASSVAVARIAAD